MSPVNVTNQASDDAHPSIQDKFEHEKQAFNFNQIAQQDVAAKPSLKILFKIQNNSQ